MHKKIIMLKFITAFLFLLSTVDSIAQVRYTISGYVEEASSQERLIGVSIYDADNFVGTTSNEYGFYSLSLPANTPLRVRTTHIGYADNEREIRLSQDTTINLILSPDSQILSTATVKAERTPIHRSSGMSTLKLSIKEVDELPAFLGEPDIMKTLQLMPGIQGGTEGTGDIHVRGGSPDQNLILLDGTPIYNASHLFGFFSVFNTDALKDVTIHKGGFPARYGGRLSSIINIISKDGDMQRWKGSWSIGLLSSRFLVEGPLKKDKTSLLIIGRSTYYDLLTRPIVAFAPETNIPVYGFQDINAKINHKFSEKDRLFFSLYAGIDRFSSTIIDDDGTERSEATFGLKWGNWASALRWNHLYNQHLFSNVSLFYSRYNFQASTSLVEKNDTETSGFSQAYDSTIEDLGLKADWSYIPSSKHYIRFGAAAIYHDFQPNATQYSINNTSNVSIDSLVDTPNIRTLEPNIYIEDEWSLHPKIKANIGLHGSMFTNSSFTYTSLQPRLSLSLLTHKSWSTKASFSTMTQYIHLLSNTGVGLPTDLWVPSTASVAPQQSWQAALGIVGDMRDGAYELMVESFYKKNDNVIEYSEGTNFLEDGPETDFIEVGAATWEDKITAGTGTAYGIEFFLKKNTGKLKGWLSYTYSHSERLFENLNQGRKFPYLYDRRHDISLVGTYKIGKKINLSANWNYTSGRPVTVPNAVLQAHPEASFNGNTPLQQFTDRNGYRLAPYHRLDISINLYKDKKRGKRILSFALYNAYSRLNPFFVYVDGRTPELYQVTLFPILPSFNYKFVFNGKKVSNNE